MIATVVTLGGEVHAVNPAWVAHILPGEAATTDPRTPNVVVLLASPPAGVVLRVRGTVESVTRALNNSAEGMEQAEMERTEADA